MFVSQTTVPWVSSSPELRLAASLPARAASRDTDGDRIGGDQESQERDAQHSAPARAQLCERHGQQQDHQQQGR